MTHAATESATAAPPRWWQGWLPASELVPLLYLGTLAFQPLFAGNTGRDWVIAGVIAGAYLPLFALAHHPRRSVTRPVIVATVVLGVAGSMVNIGAPTLLVYAGGTAAWTERKQVTLRILVGLTALLGLLLVAAPTPWPFRAYGIVPTLVFLWLVAWQQFDQAASVAEAQRLRVDNVRIEQLAAASERERIARDMHDLLGHSLTSLVVRAQLIQGLVAADPTAVADHAAGLERDARTALQQLRASVSGLQEVSLSDELDSARRVLATAGVAADVRDPGDQPPPLAERMLALALREGVTNVVRHARANSCSIALDHTADGWSLEIIDDGVGIAQGRGGNGIDGMTARVVAIGGRASIGPAHSGGTRLRVAVPA